MKTSDFGFLDSAFLVSRNHLTGAGWSVVTVVKLKYVQYLPWWLKAGRHYYCFFTISVLWCFMLYKVLSRDFISSNRSLLPSRTGSRLGESKWLGQGHRLLAGAPGPELGLRVVGQPRRSLHRTLPGGAQASVWRQPLEAQPEPRDCQAGCLLLPFVFLFRMSSMNCLLYSW